MNDVLDEFDVAIERILPKGVGLGHADGRTVFVPLTASGDTVRVRTKSVKGSLVFAELVEVLSPGEDRVNPPCRYYGECGGCDLQHLGYEAQLTAKIGIIRDCFDRIGKFEYPEPEIIANTKAFGYRTRARIHLERSTGSVGFFRRDSNDIVDIERCDVLDDQLQRSVDEIRSRRDEFLKRGQTEIDLSWTDDGVLISEGELNDTDSGSIVVGDFRYHISASSFFQGSRSMLEQLISAATEGISDMDCLDLYSGVGLFTMPLARTNRSVIAIESNQNAVDLARQNVNTNELENIDVIREKVFRYLRNATPGVQAIIFDPPRIGLERGVADSIFKLGPPIISYVSCEPATLARDLRTFIDGGYVIQKVTAIDLFPQTHHIETVVRLTRT